MMAKLNKIMLLLQISLFFVLSIHPDDSIPYMNQSIKINPSNRPLITGVDLDKVMSRYIDDYSVFERSAMISPFSIIWLWNVKPDPNDPETQYFWGSKRDTPFYKRQFNITIGIFPSHEEAVKRTVEMMKTISIVIPLIDHGEREPGYVAWDRGYTVRDNVLYAVDFCTEPFHREELQKQLGRDFLEGAEGISKGAFVELPEIDGSDIPDEVAIPLNGKITLSLRASDPTSRKLYRRASFFKEKNSSMIPPTLRAEAPSVDWIEPDALEIKERGSISGTLEAVVINDHCVISDVFKKRISIKVPDTVE
ncbi:MAG: hypothetical protein JXR73_06630 [Candidatus Omnitrophica bacterium]|nr:hypothetical protein [Candidatus Omnitrophota bacterium]